MVTVATNSTGMIVMFSEGGSPTPPPGGNAFALTDVQYQTLKALDATPNGGITFDGTNFAALPFVPPVQLDMSNINNLDKLTKAIGLTIASLTGHTPAEVVAAFKTAWNSLP